MLDSVDDEDEVLLEMARELEKFTDYVGGSEYAHYILTPLERLATMEEVLVRDRVSNSKSNSSMGFSHDKLTLFKGSRISLWHRLRLESNPS